MKSTRSIRWGHYAGSRRRLRLAVPVAVAAGLLLSLTALAAAVTPAAADLSPANSVPQLIPKPVSMTVGQGTFTLAATARIVVPSGSAAALPVAQDLADYLRP